MHLPNSKSRDQLARSETVSDKDMARHQRIESEDEDLPELTFLKKRPLAPSSPHRSPRRKATTSEGGVNKRPRLEPIQYPRPSSASSASLPSGSEHVLPRAELRNGRNAELPPLAPLHNLNNTCFLNAASTLLLTNSEVKSHLLSIPQAVINSGATSELRLCAGLIAILLAPPHEPFAPATLVEEAWSEGSSIQVVRGQQGDQAEAENVMLDAIKTVLSQDMPPLETSTSSVMETAFLIGYENDPRSLGDTRLCALRTCRTDNCIGRKTRFERQDSIQLQLPTPVPDSTSLSELLDAMTEEGDCEVTCAECGRAPHKVVYRLSRLPMTIRLSISRFHLDGRYNTAVSIPSCITVRGITSALMQPISAEYVVQAVGCHVGETRESGHCISYARTASGWWSYNDSTCTGPAVFPSIDPRTVYSVILVRRDALDYAAELALTTITRSVGRPAPAPPARPSPGEYSRLHKLTATASRAATNPTTSTALSTSISTLQPRNSTRQTASDTLDPNSYPFKLSTKSGNVKKREKRATDEFKENQIASNTANILQRRQALEQIDAEKDVYAKYLHIRSSIPSSDDELEAMASDKVRSLYLEVVKRQVEAHMLEPVNKNSLGLRILLTKPNTMRALLSLCRNPYTFSPTRWPMALVRASPKLVAGSTPAQARPRRTSQEGDGSSDDNSEEETSEEEGVDPEESKSEKVATKKKCAQYYTRFYTELKTDLSIHLAAFHNNHGHYHLRARAMAQEIASHEDGAKVRLSVPYSGITIAATPIERLNADNSSRWRMISNWLRPEYQQKGTQIRATVYEWLELKTQSVATAELRGDNDVAALEFYIVLATKPVGLNSAHGGNGMVSYQREQEVVRCADAVRRWRLLQSPQPEHEDVPIKIRKRREALQADILRHYDFMQEVFEHLDDDSTGITMTRGELNITARLAAALDLDSKGRLVKMPLVAKDITREAFVGGVQTSYRGVYAGHGPRYERWLRQRAFEAALPAMAEYDENIAQLYGPFTDLWSIILLHEDWVIIIVIVLLSRYLLLFRKHNVPLPLFLVHSSKVTNIFLSDLVRQCWRPDLTMTEFQAFMDEPTLDNFRAVLPGDLQSFSTDDLKSLATELDMDDWEKLKISNFNECAGNLATVHIGPFNDHQCLILMSRHTGFAKYKPQLFQLLQVADELVYLKYVIAEKLARRSSDSISDLKQLKKDIEGVSQACHLETAIKSANNKVANLINTLNGIAQRRRFTTGFKAATARMSAICSNSVQADTAQHIVSKGKPYSKERITQGLEIIDSIRAAYGRSLALPDDLKHLSPPAIVPGSLDHLRFLVEFVDENKSIIRSTGGYTSSYGNAPGFRTESKARQKDTGINDAVTVLERSTQKKKQHICKVVYCKACKRTLLTAQCQVLTFRHACTAHPDIVKKYLGVTSPSTTSETSTSEAALDSSITSFGRDKSIPASKDKEIQSYLSEVAKQKVPASAPKVHKAGPDWSKDPRPTVGSPLLTLYHKAPLPYVILRDYDDGTCTDDAMLAKNLYHRSIHEILSQQDRAKFVNIFGEAVLFQLDDFGTPVWNKKERPLDSCALVQRQIVAILQEFAYLLTDEAEATLVEDFIKSLRIDFQQFQ